MKMEMQEERRDKTENILCLAIRFMYPEKNLLEIGID